MSKTITKLLVGVLQQVGATKRTGKDRTSMETATSARMGVGSWIVLIVLLLLLIATGVVVYSSFKFRSLSKIVTAGALGDEEWKRVEASAGNDPNNPKK